MQTLTQVEADAVVITHNPESMVYSLQIGWRGTESGGGTFATLRDAVLAADPDGNRLWEDPSGTDMNLHRDVVLFSVARRS